MMKRARFFVILLVGSIFMVSCSKIFDYSPYAIDFEEHERNLNVKNYNRLKSDSEPDSIIKIACTGDSHRFYDETEAFVNQVNEMDSVDFVLHVGDLADFGLPKQFQWGNGLLENLKVPYFVTVGNHDLVGNGLEAYKALFGSLDYSFIYQGIKFVLVNTNSREFEFDGSVPNLQSLDNELIPSAYFTKAVVVFHVPPFDVDFDSQLETRFEETLLKYNNVLFTVHGHLHHHSITQPYSDSLVYVNVFGAEHLRFNVITISNSSYHVETVEI
jgi:Icc-related predicted phosphoesterase